MTEDDRGWRHHRQPVIRLIGDAGPALHDACTALTGLGVNGVTPVPLADGPIVLAAPAAIDAVMIEATGADADALELLLDTAVALLSQSDVAIVIALDDSQIDQVAASVLTGRVDLLCSPNVGDRAAALSLALAIQPTNRVRQAGGGRDRDNKQLHDLNLQVARIAETLARLTTGEGDGRKSSLLADRSPGYRAQVPADTGEIAARDVRQSIRARRMREQFFGAGLFEDPAWDILLDLFAADLERGRVSVSSLCIAAAVAPTTALRWISRMTEGGLLEREADPFDRRRAFMQLTPATRSSMRSYWAAVRQLGAGIM